MVDYASAIRRAVLEASRLHRDLSSESRVIRGTGRVDVYDAIARLDVPLVFTKLDGLLGVYLRDPSPGILITTQRRQSQQRFTAAHEQIVGSLAGGVLCDRFDRKLVYCVAGVAIALVAAAMAFGPRTPVAFVAASLLYLLVLGTCYASFNAVGLEAIGKGAAATKLMVFICVSNLSINLVEFADGVVHDRLDVAGMLLFEAALGGVSVLLFAGVVWWTGRSRSVAARQGADEVVLGG